MTENLPGLVKSSIDEWAARLRSESPLVHAAREGRVGARALAVYLESLRYTFSQSRSNILAAAERSDAMKLPELAAYFRHKADEENGHDQWAAHDLTRLPRAAAQGVEPAAASRALVALQRELIEQHPICFLAYAIWAEYLTASLGDEWLRMLARSGFERSQVSAIAKHVEADVDHADEGFEVLDRLWPGQPAPSDVLHAVVRAERGFEAFCAEIAEVARTSPTASASTNARG